MTTSTGVHQWLSWPGAMRIRTTCRRWRGGLGITRNTVRAKLDAALVAELELLLRKREH